jgi:alpha-tubulin suppressor-like RCC1 family protein
MNTQITPTALVLLLAVLGCREDAESPTEPASTSPQGSVAPAAALSFRQVSVASNHTCGVTTDDRAYCWGDNTYGQLGTGSSAGPETCSDASGAPCSTRPVAVTGGLRFHQVSVGGGGDESYTCGVTTDDRAYCWGDNTDGQLGDGTTTSSPSPVAVAGGRRFRQVRTGGNHTCAVDPFDAAFCWGDNSAGKIGDGTTTDRRTPVRVLAGLRFRQLTAGGSHTCGATTGDRAYCWGWNALGQLGDRTTTDRARPTPVAGGLRFRQVSAGGNHNCAVTRDDQAYCWGKNRFGQLGNGTRVGPETCQLFGGNPCSTKPVAVLRDLPFRAVSSGNDYTCGVTTTSIAYCWGRNLQGQLGDGTQYNTRVRPVAVLGGLQFRAVSGGAPFGRSTCGVTTDGAAYCWGSNHFGQLGDWTTTSHLTPTAVAGPS